jgi:putative hydrolase of the HAD superfamily
LTSDIIGIYFDFFGTLIDSVYAVANVWSLIASKLGKEIAWDDLRIAEGVKKQHEEYELRKLKSGKLYINLTEDDWNSMNHIVLDHMDVKTEGLNINGVHKTINKEFEKHLTIGRFGRLYPGCIETLEQIKDRNIKIGLHTHAPREECQSKLKELKIYEFFDIFIHTGDFGYNKSNIEMYQIALNAMKTSDPKKIIHVGDNLDLDVKMAQKVGMTPILFDPNKEYLLKDIIVINEMPELLKYV